VTEAELRAYARVAATRAGVDPGTFERQIDQESGFNPDAHNPSGADGIAQIIERWHPAMAGKTRDPIASLDYAASLLAGYVKQFGSYRKALAAYNFGSGNVGGYTKPDGTVVKPWDGQRSTLPSETQRYLDVILGPEWQEPSKNLSAELPTSVAYNPDALVDPQPDDFSCSLQSAQWLLRSIGRNPERPWLVKQLVGPLYPGSIITQEYGLMDSSGKTLAAWLQKEYGDEMGVTFAARPVNTWDDLVALAGKGPVMLGGRAYGHWVGVRSYQDGKVQLANPAGSWKGVGQELTRDEFDALGSWSAVTATLPAPGVGTGPSSSNDEDRVLGLTAALAHVCDIEVPRLVRAVEERDAALTSIRQIREQQIGVKP
jgi:hypothetical protein